MQFTTLVALAVSYAVAAQAATVASDPAAARPTNPNHHPHQRVNVRFFKDAQCKGQARTVELNRDNANRCNNAGTDFRSLIVDVPQGSHFNVNDLQVGRDNCAQNTLRRIQKANACVDLGGKEADNQFIVNHKRRGGKPGQGQGDEDDE